MTTAAATIQQMAYRTGKIHYIANSYLTIDSTTTFSAPHWLANVADSTNSFLGWGVWRPTAASAADYFRHISGINVTSGQVTIDRAWSDSTLGTEDFYLLAPGINPIHIINALNLALDHIYFVNTEPLSEKPAGALVADAGFQATATSNYTASGSTFSKVTTDNSENIYDGIGAGRILNAGYIYQQFSVTPNELIHSYALTRLDTGTNFEHVLYDVSNSAAIGTTVEHAQEAYQWTVRRETVPTGCKLLQVRYQAEGATDDVYISGQCTLFPNRARVTLDTKWDSKFKTMRLLYADLGGTSVADGVYQAHASQIMEVPPSDYRFVFQRSNANPGYVQFFNQSQKTWMNYPLFIFGRRPYSAVTTIAISDLTTVCDAPIDLWEGLAAKELFMMGDVSSKVTNAGAEYMKASARAAAADLLTADDAAPPAKLQRFSSWGRI